MIDGGFGFEMETFEFLNLLQVRWVVCVGGGTCVVARRASAGGAPGHGMGQQKAAKPTCGTLITCCIHQPMSILPLPTLPPGARLPQGHGRADAPGRIQGGVGVGGGWAGSLVCCEQWLVAGIRALRPVAAMRAGGASWRVNLDKPDSKPCIATTLNLAALRRMRFPQDTKALKKTKKALKHRFWTEIYQGGWRFFSSPGRVTGSSARVAGNCQQTIPATCLLDGSQVQPAADSDALPHPGSPRRRQAVLPVGHEERQVPEARGAQPR